MYSTGTLPGLTAISIIVREVMQKSELDQAKQVRGDRGLRASAGLQVKWRQVVKYYIVHYTD